MRRRHRPHHYPPEAIPRQLRRVRVNDCESSWDYAVRRDPYDSLSDWEETVQRVESDGLFPKHGLTIDQEIARVTRPVVLQEPRNLFFGFYFKGSPREAREAAYTIQLVLRRIVRESLAR